MKRHLESLSDIQRIALIGIVIGFILLVANVVFRDYGLYLAYLVIYWPSLIVFWTDSIIRFIGRGKFD